MKGIKFLIVVMLLGTVFSYNVKMASAASKTETLYVVADQLNVREKDSTKSKKVGSLKIGSKVKVYSQAKNGWSKIDFKKKKAYVYSKYIKKAPKNQFSRIKFFAKQGQVETTLPVVVGDKAFTAIDYLGKPVETDNFYSDLRLMYNKYSTILFVYEDNRKSEITYKTMTKKSYVSRLEQYFNNNKNITYKNIKSTLGKADGSSTFLGADDFMISYELGKYRLIFHTHNLGVHGDKLTDRQKFASYSVYKKN